MGVKALTTQASASGRGHRKLLSAIILFSENYLSYFDAIPEKSQKIDDVLHRLFGHHHSFNSGLLTRRRSPSSLLSRRISESLSWCN